MSAPLKRSCVTLACAFFASLLTSCATEPDDFTTSDLEEAASSNGDLDALERLSALGFDVSEAVVVGDSISIDDIAFSRSELMSGGYDWVLRDAWREADKAHFVGGMPLYGLSATQIKLAWETGADAPDQTMKDAFITAAGDINSTCNTGTGCLINISQNNTGPQIVIHSRVATSWPPTLCAGSVGRIGCTQFPSSKAPGGHLYLKRSHLTSSCVSWSASALAHTARHELLHALGINHPGVGSQISGTAAAPASTIMTAYSAMPGCTLSPTLLQTDDKAGLRNLPMDPNP